MIVKLLLDMLSLFRVTGRHLQVVRYPRLASTRSVRTTSPRMLEAISLYVIMCVLLSNATTAIGYDKR